MSTDMDVRPSTGPLSERPTPEPEQAAAQETGRPAAPVSDPYVVMHGFRIEEMHPLAQVTPAPEAEPAPFVRPEARPVAMQVQAAVPSRLSLLVSRVRPYSTWIGTAVAAFAVIGGFVTMAPKPAPVAPASAPTASEAAEVRIGEAFRVGDLSIQQSWAVDDTLRHPDITGLQAKNTGARNITAHLEAHLMLGNEVAATADCFSRTIEPGHVAPVWCVSDDPFPADFDRIRFEDVTTAQASSEETASGDAAAAIRSVS